MFGKYLTRLELGELQALIKIIRTEQLKLKLVEGNTAVVHQAKEWIQTQQGLIQLLENEKENFISKCAHRLGFEGAIELNLSNGKIWSKK